MGVPDRHGVVAVLQDDTGRYLLIRRGLSLVRAPGWWCFPGGEVEAGESLEQAIEREVWEELGVRVSAREKVHESISPNGVYRLHWLRVIPAGPLGELRPHEIEVAEAVWLSAEDILAREQVLPGLISWLKDQQQPRSTA
jgi:8-oxo-dGTP pyrophosphatase MutT (NUDIX family)